MATLKIDMPDEILEDLTEVAKRLKQTPEETVQMALSLLMQFDSLDYGIIAIERMNDGAEPISLPTADDDAQLNIEFHPEALGELEVLDEDEQIDVLTELVERIVAEEDDVGGLDLVLQEDDDSQVILSSFEFGDIVYKIGDKIAIYTIAIPDFESEEFEIDFSQAGEETDED